jgi:hypothetical protein
MTTQEFRLPRPGATDLVFEGEMLVDRSSREGRQPRWTEIRIYRTVGGMYVTEMVGRSDVAGERDRVSVNVSRTPGGVRKGVSRTDGDRTWLTEFALECLDEAAERDDGLAHVTEDRIT